MEAFNQLLVESGYDHKETNFLTQGVKKGFPLHYHGPVNRQDMVNNLPLRCSTAFDLQEKVMKEVVQKRYAGPFETIPFSNYVLVTHRETRARTDRFDFPPQL